MNVAAAYLDSIKKRFATYKSLGDKTFEQLSDEEMFWKKNEASNSIAVIIRHMSGNMLSRFTDFLTSDGEKPWRKRDEEFEDKETTKAAILAEWEKGWHCMLSAINALSTDDLTKTVYIRNEPHDVLDAINRQLSHHAYHVGQIVYIAKMLKGEQWKSLTIPKGQSEKFNHEKFNKK